jgi:hypothetical protein
MRPAQFDLPESFIRRYEPVRAHPNGRGLGAYLFDGLALDFYRQLATAQPISAGAIWSVMAVGSSFCIHSGRRDDALGYVVTNRPLHPPAAASIPLEKRLTYRQKIRRAAFRSLLAQLQSAPFPVPADVLRFIEESP